MPITSAYERGMATVVGAGVADVAPLSYFKSRRCLSGGGVCPASAAAIPANRAKARASFIFLFMGKPKLVDDRCVERFGRGNHGHILVANKHKLARTGGGYTAQVIRQLL